MPSACTIGSRSACCASGLGVLRRRAWWPRDGLAALERCPSWSRRKRFLTAPLDFIFGMGLPLGSSRAGGESSTSNPSSLACRTAHGSRLRARGTRLGVQESSDSCPPVASDEYGARHDFTASRVDPGRTRRVAWRRTPEVVRYVPGTVFVTCAGSQVAAPEVVGSCLALSCVRAGLLLRGGPGVLRRLGSHRRLGGRSPESGSFSAEALASASGAAFLPPGFWAPGLSIMVIRRPMRLAQAISTFATWDMCSATTVFITS